MNKNTAAYPTELKLSNQADRSFTKEEVVFKDILCATLSNASVIGPGSTTVSFAKRMMATAAVLTQAYFDHFEPSEKQS